MVDSLIIMGTLNITTMVLIVMVEAQGQVITVTMAMARMGILAKSRDRKEHLRIIFS